MVGSQRRLSNPRVEEIAAGDRWETGSDDSGTSSTRRVEIEVLSEKSDSETSSTTHHQLSRKTAKHLQRRKKAEDNIPSREEATQGEGGDEARRPVRKEKKLGQWLSTGLCGNNITSSALYVVALCSAPAGKYAPIALLCIAALLYLYRSIYEEVVLALPVNGGTYNLLLNTTSKKIASVAACLTMLSYVTTAVISATSAMRYVHSACAPEACAVFADDPDTSVIVSTLLVIALAAVLNLLGVTESAAVALVIFVTHMATMALLICASLVKAIVDMPTEPRPDGGAGLGGGGVSNASAVLLPMLQYNWQHTEPVHYGVAGAIFFGYSSGLLGVSGFESSSNFVENQVRACAPRRKARRGGAARRGGEEVGRAGRSSLLAPSLPCRPSLTAPPSLAAPPLPAPPSLAAAP